MDLILNEQTVSHAAWMSSGGKESLTEGQVNEITLDDLLVYLTRTSQYAMTIELQTDRSGVVIELQNEAGVTKHKLTVTCDVSDYDELVTVLRHTPCRTRPLEVVGT